MTIYAYTPAESQPGYVNLSKRDGKYILSVRTKGEQYASSIEIPFLELLKLQSSILGSCINASEDD